MLSFNEARLRKENSQIFQSEICFKPLTFSEKKKRKGNCSCNIMIMEMNRISLFLVRTTNTKKKGRP